VAKRVSKYPVLRTTFPRILDYRATRLRAYMVDGRNCGNGRRHYFRKLADAKTCADQLTTELRKDGHARRFRAFQRITMTPPKVSSEILGN
jgi:hypothetical protein